MLRNQETDLVLANASITFQRVTYYDCQDVLEKFLVDRMRIGLVRLDQHVYQVFQSDCYSSESSSGKLKEPSESRSTR